MSVTGLLVRTMEAVGTHLDLMSVDVWRAGKDTTVISVSKS